MKRKHLLTYGMLAFSLLSAATPVRVTMNAVSTTMTLADARGNEVPVGTPNNKKYEFDVEPGRYTLTAFDKNGTTVNGSICIDVVDNPGSIFGGDTDDQYKEGIDDVNQFTIITCTAYVTNKHEGTSTNWNTEDGDYTLTVSVNTREGVRVEQEPGKSSTANRYTFLALNGNSYLATFEPSGQHKAEGYMTLYRGGTLTANVNVYGAIPAGGPFSITIPQNADLQLGMKFTHFTDFTPVKPDEIVDADGGKTYKFTLANGQVYNYRTWMPGGLTHGGYFTMNTADASKCPVINFTRDDYSKNDPKAINHSVSSNNGYETGDILLNINPEHHLKLMPGEEFLVHGMRMWEISDNSTNNYFFEPDFHYIVLDTEFNPCDDVIEIDNADTNVSAWSRIKAKTAGTAVVLVTYDGINLNYYNNADKKEYLGGEYWGAIWPENTGVFIVTVDDDSKEIKPNMTVNEKYNEEALKLSGKFVDAEHDVFYFLDDEDGFRFTFKPEGVADVDMASPVISETKAEYAGFSKEGVTKNEDGSYSLLLRNGRNIVRLTDAGGKSVYQVLRAKPCHRDITNQTRPGSAVYQPGDKIKIQYSGLFHPANKIAGIYNMSAYVTYNGVPNGSSLILGSGQYTFGSAPSAQAVTVEIPADHDLGAQPALIMNEGVIQVNGYGDPIGNHRNTSPLAGRSPNFTAVPHKTYFGALPDIKIELSPVRYFDITLCDAPEGAEVVLKFNDELLRPDEDGHYKGTYGTYSIAARAEGYKAYYSQYTIGDDASDKVQIPVSMQPLGNAWDGKTVTVPKQDEDGVYLISKPSDLAWLAQDVNANGVVHDARLLNDIELGNFNWTPIGTSSKPYAGSFNGEGHTVSEIYVNEKSNHKGLFGYVNGAEIVALTVAGSVSGAQYVGGIAGYVAGTTLIDRCANFAAVSGTKTYVGGIVGHLNSANAVLTNCYNAGKISGTTNCGGVAGNNNANAEISNIFNVGEVDGTTVGSCVGGTTAKTKMENAFSVMEYQITTGQTTVTDQQMASGEVAYKLGDAFGQIIGLESHPVLGGVTVYLDEDTEEYYNETTGIEANILKIDAENLVLDVDKNTTATLNVTYSPVYADEPALVWTSSDESVVWIDYEGHLYAVVKAMNPGTATVRVTNADNPDLFATCSVSVTGATTLVESLFDGDGWETADVFDISGRIVRLKAGAEFIKTLAPGFYIIRSGNETHNIIIQ